MKEGQKLTISGFNLESLDYLDEETLVQALTEKIAQMLDTEIDLLFSTLYRLDIFETKINAVLDNPVIPNDEGLARLVIERQKEKLESRRKYQTKKDENLDGLEL